MKEFIAIIRTSTERQEIESQRKELLDFIAKDGVDKSRVEVIGEAGASAIKLDERYRKNLEKVYSIIKKGGVKCVYAWALDRIGRNEQVMFSFKQFLIDNGVNLKIVNPSLVLLNPDGTVNSGMEIAFSLYVTMSKQEMEQKQSRFKRAKERNREMGKYCGGGQPLFGYTVDDNGFLQPHPEDSEVIRLIFELYATGKYSIKKLVKELEERGVNMHHAITRPYVCRYLQNESYCGRSKYHYPAIVSEELFDRCAQLRKDNKIMLSREHHRYYFASKLITCPKCGHKLVSYGRSYKCSYHYYHKCDCPYAPSVNVIDGLLWHYAKQLETDMLLNQGKNDLKKLNEELEILRNKEKTLISQASLTDTKIENTKQLYAEALITREKFDSLIAKHKEADKERQNRLLEIQESIHAIEASIERINNPDGFFEDLSDISFKLESIRQAEKMSEIVHRQIKEVSLSYTNDGKRGYNITAYSHTGQKMEFRYYANNRIKIKLYINGIPDKLENYVIDRSKLKSYSLH
ncbi:MAG: recombinase family protein [Clostridia bacterium]|nr:recombinase family protein [Clostridia bacterium]